eukprot:2809631-Amphidinium_carterae.1
MKKSSTKGRHYRNWSCNRCQLHRIRSFTVIPFKQCFSKQPPNAPRRSPVSGSVLATYQRTNVNLGTMLLARELRDDVFNTRGKAVVQI